MGKIAAALEKSGQQLEAARPDRAVHKPEQATAAHSKGAASRRKSKPTPSLTDRNLVVLSQSNPFAVEQFNQLKTNLLFGNSKPPQLIMITSALPGEGKSFVAANLAASIAQNIKEHVLLIDCDLRRPAIHRIFGLQDPPGLSDYLQNGKDLSEFLIKTGHNKLTLLPAGRSPRNPLELLSSEKMKDLLKEVKERYGDRFVILDSPPPRLTAESNALARLVDGVVLVVKKGAAGRDVINDLVKGIGKEKLAGVVFNHFEMPKLSALGYGKYGKYGKYHQYYK
jgi:exopolysaccharide/PEP-CTERM locus tyrosine autokinase